MLQGCRSRGFSCIGQDEIAQVTLEASAGPRAWLLPIIESHSCYLKAICEAYLVGSCNGNRLDCWSD